MKFVRMISFGLLAMALSACNVISSNFKPEVNKVINGSGNVISETRKVSGFNSVSLSGIGELTIKVGDEESLLIEAEDNLGPLLTSEVSQGKLDLGTKPGVSLNPTKPIRYTLVVKDLNAIEISGLGSVRSVALKADRIHIGVSGSGNLSIAGIEADQLIVDISGLGSVTVAAGKVNSQKISLSGSGSYKANDLESSTADVEISGLGNATLWAKDQLKADISGSGNVDYYGSPAVTADRSGLGRVNSLGEH